MDKLIDVVSPPVTGSIQAEAEQLLNKEAGKKIPVSAMLLVLTADVLSKTVGIKAELQSEDMTATYQEDVSVLPGVCEGRWGRLPIPSVHTCVRDLPPGPTYNR